jgi:hypothetical protein
MFAAQTENVYTVIIKTDQPQNQICATKCRCTYMRGTRVKFRLFEYKY